MKRYITKITIAFLAALLVVNMTMPYHVMASTHGTVTISGYVSYQDRDNSLEPARDIQIDLYERDRNGYDTYLGQTTFTQANGYFTFPPIVNYWPVDNGPLNVFYKITTRSLSERTEL